MPPKRAQKPRSSPRDEAIPCFPAPPTTIPTKMADGPHTPERSPAKKAAGITQAQKQALIDNLQLEITERARKLRAQYALQAQGLRARLEMRVNRVPQALRKRNIQELLDEHAERAKPTPPPPVPAKETAIRQPAAPPVKAPAGRGVKRHSDVMSNDEDKENAPAETSHDLPNPKKRTKTAAATANSKATRTASRKAAPSTVLSPKSHNSRTLARPPFNPAASPAKPTTMQRPGSPVKRSVAPPKPAPRTASRQVKRTAAAEGRSSDASNTSAGTTIITKTGTKRAPAAKKPTAPKAATTGRKATAAKRENPPPVPAGGGRTLRKRG